MNSPFALTAEETMTDDFEQLTNIRPLRVLTHLFDTAAPAPPLVPDDSPDIRGHFHRASGRHTIAPHDHQHYEMGFVIAGHGRHCTAMYESDVSRGTVIIIAPGKVHGVRDIDGLGIVNCFYLTEWLLHEVHELWSLEGLIPLFLAAGMFTRPQNAWIPQFQLTEQELQTCLRELGDIAAEWDRTDPARTYMRCCLEKLIITLARAYARTGLPGPQIAPQPWTREALRSIEGCVVEGTLPSVNAIAATVGMAPDYFSRAFKRATGWSPMEYFQRGRVQHASWLLLNANRTITEVAHELGFYDSAHFSRLFKRYQGASPRAYQRRHRSTDG